MRCPFPIGSQLLRPYGNHAVSHGSHSWCHTEETVHTEEHLWESMSSTLRMSDRKLTQFYQRDMRPSNFNVWYTYPVRNRNDLNIGSQTDKTMRHVSLYSLFLWVVLPIRIFRDWFYSLFMCMHLPVCLHTCMWEPMEARSCQTHHWNGNGRWLWAAQYGCWGPDLGERSTP